MTFCIVDYAFEDMASKVGLENNNAVWAGPVSALRWVPLSAYAADGKSAACSKGHALQ